MFSASGSDSNNGSQSSPRALLADGRQRRILSLVLLKSGNLHLNGSSG